MDEEATATEEGLDVPGSWRGGVGDGYAAAGASDAGGVACAASASASAASGGQVGIAGLEGLSQQHPPDAVRGPSGWIYHSTSLFVLRPHHFPRNLAIQIVEAPFFEPAIALTIGANIVTMAWNSPLDDPDTPKADLIAVSTTPHHRTKPGAGSSRGPHTLTPATLPRPRATAMRNGVPRHFYV